VGLGVVAAVSLAIFGRPLGASGAYQSLAAYVGRPLFPRDVFFSAIMPPRVEWQAFVLAGVFLGALLGSLLAGEHRLRWVPEEGWRERFGPDRRVRWAVAFLGAFLVELGAGIAGGCTSGLAVSGGVVLAPGAFVFMAGMFAAGVPAAVMIGRRARR
jgi:uncharacterized membrane protein YedE/YeeE